MVNGKKKGAAGEREFSNYCKSKGFDTRRTAQYKVKPTSIKHSKNWWKFIFSLISRIFFFSLLCRKIWVWNISKRVEKLNIHEAVKQAKRDNKNHGDIPIVAHRKNNTKWLITMDADDWFKLFYGIELEGKEDGKSNEEA